jgi:pyridoxine 5-phosphate synthase
MTRLSVNINKVATLRNARGGDNPNVIQVAKDLESFGVEGITVHPRPDERHIRYNDVIELKQCLSVELNIEGNPREKKFVDLVLKVKPHQVTLVPDSNMQLTSDHGWDTIANHEYLSGMISVFKEAGIRTSIFVDPDVKMIEGAAKVGTDRIELYTESYAAVFPLDQDGAILPYLGAAERAVDLGLSLNAGHDLSLINLNYFKSKVNGLKEVSIGHAFIADALYFGLEETTKKYLKALK